MNLPAAPRLKRGDRIVIATHNSGKAREFASLFAPLGIETVSAAELGLIEPEETGSSFVENAQLKAVASAVAAGRVALADDSGLEVAALGGQPGIHSARWGGEKRDFGLAMTRVHQALQSAAATDLRANFTCALALASPRGEVQTFEGKVFGALTWPPRGSRGFGYDPIFVPEGYEETFGEMDAALKDQISHRARAFKTLIETSYDADR